MLRIAIQLAGSSVITSCDLSISHSVFDCHSYFMLTFLHDRHRVIQHHFFLSILYNICFKLHCLNYCHHILKTIVHVSIKDIEEKKILLKCFNSFE